MRVKDCMREDPVYVKVDDTLAKAIDAMIASHQNDVWVVDGQQRFVGEIRSVQFAKILAPVTVGSHYEQESAISADESIAESLENARERMQPYLARKVDSFVNHDVAVARPDLPIGSGLMLLRGGMNRVPVVEAGSSRLLGTLSMLTVLARLRD